MIKVTMRQDDSRWASTIAEMFLGDSLYTSDVALSTTIDEHPRLAIADEITVTDFHWNANNFWRDLLDLIHSRN